MYFLTFQLLRITLEWLIKCRSVKSITNCVRSSWWHIVNTRFLLLLTLQFPKKYCFAEKEQACVPHQFSKDNLKTQETVVLQSKADTGHMTLVFPDYNHESRAVQALWSLPCIFLYEFYSWDNIWYNLTAIKVIITVLNQP